MVKKKKSFYTFADWRKENPIENDITLLINAAKSYALSQVPHVGSECGAPDEPTGRFDDEPTELELAIHRAETAIRLMMHVSQARKAAGLKKKTRGSDISYAPDRTTLTDPQVQVVLKWLRNEIEQQDVYIEVAEMIAPKGKIDERTLNGYIDALVQIWGQYADPNLQSLWVQSTES